MLNGGNKQALWLDGIMQDLGTMQSEEGRLQTDAILGPLQPLQPNYPGPLYAASPGSGGTQTCFPGLHVVLPGSGTLLVPLLSDEYQPPEGTMHDLSPDSSLERPGQWHSGVAVLDLC